MRLWSLSPEYLDRQGLLALWREGLLAKKVLERKTKGYKNHPQLIRFRETEKPLDYINAYLFAVLNEAERRGYDFRGDKLRAEAGGLKNKLKNIKVSSGQLAYEFQHLLGKLKKRDLARYEQYYKIDKIKVNSLFKVVKGGVASWEKIK